MIKALAILGVALVMFYYFFGAKFIGVLGLIFLALMTLIFFNQNKILYMPGKVLST